MALAPADHGLAEAYKRVPEEGRADVGRDFAGGDLKESRALRGVFRKLEVAVLK